MLKLKNKNGITLIALIITIIVMLILVGVTITMALGEGGLVAKTKEAKNKMEGAAEADVLQELALGAIGTNGVVDFNKLDEKVSQSELFTGTNGTYTSEKGNTFTVDANGKVTLLGQGAGGGTGAEISIGDNVTYQGIEWIVFNINGDQIDLVSADAMGSITIGGNGDVYNETSFNNLETILTNECKSETGITTNIRTINKNDIEVMRGHNLSIVAQDSQKYWINFKEIVEIPDSGGVIEYKVYCINSQGALANKNAFINQGTASPEEGGVRAVITLTEEELSSAV